MKKSIHFILDELVFKNLKDIDKIEEYLIFNNSFFTNTKKNLIVKKNLMKDFIKLLCIV